MLTLIIVFLVCCAIALLIHSSKSAETDHQQSQMPQPPIEQPKKRTRKKKVKVRSYDDWQKRMRKKKYLSEHSELVTVSVEDVQKYALRNPGQKELIDQILEAIMDGRDYMQIDRKTYNELISEKYSNS